VVYNLVNISSLTDIILNNPPVKRVHSISLAAGPDVSPLTSALTFSLLRLPWQGRPRFTSSIRRSQPKDVSEGDVGPSRPPRPPGRRSCRAWKIFRFCGILCLRVGSSVPSSIIYIISLSKLSLFRHVCRSGLVVFDAICCQSFLDVIRNI